MLWRANARPHGRGAVLSLYLMLYSAVRFGVEFVRYHEQGNLFGGPLDTSQWISLALFAAGSAWWLRTRKSGQGGVALTTIRFT